MRLINSMNVGILGIGFYLPKQVRTNDWWPKSITDKWMEDKERTQIAVREIDLESDDTPEEIRLLLNAMSSYKNDPFDGSVKRYVMADNEKTSDLEIQAAKEVLQNTGISPKKIDFILGATTLSDKLNDSNACLVQHGVGIPKSVYSQDIVGMCNSFLSQLKIAKALIQNGGMKYGLLIQSSGMSRFVRKAHPMSPAFGDGASAVLVGPVDDGYGVLDVECETDGSFANYLMLGSPGKRWYEAGEITTYFYDPAKAIQVVIAGLASGRPMTEAALAKLKLRKEDVNFFAGHQGAIWFRRVSQKLIGLDKAKFFDTYPLYSGLVGVNIPATLYNASKEKIIKKGDIISSYAPATGQVSYSVLIRWTL